MARKVCQEVVSDTAKRREDFKKNCETLSSLGIEFLQPHEYRGKPGSMRQPHVLPFFSYVRLPLTAEEWCGLCMKEGNYYIGGCCGSSSAAQDIINEIFRFQSGLAEIRQLAEIAEFMIEHDEGSDTRNFQDGGDLAGWGSLDPWKKIAVIWHLVKDHWVQDLPDIPRNKNIKRLKKKDRKISEVEQASRVLRLGLQNIAFCELFNQDDEDKARSAAVKLTWLHKTIPALKVVWKGISLLKPKPFNGFAIVKKDDGQVAENGLGPCIYREEKAARKILNMWKENEKEHQDRSESNPPLEIDSLFMIERIKVSVRNGMEFPDRPIKK